MELQEDSNHIHIPILHTYLPLRPAREVQLPPPQVQNVQLEPPAVQNAAGSMEQPGEATPTTTVVRAICVVVPSPKPEKN